MRSPITVAWIRGAFINMFEGQNYCLPSLIKLTGYASKSQQFDQEFPFAVKRLNSFSDMQFSPFIRNTIIEKMWKYTFNRILGDSQNLFGLEKELQKYDIIHTADPHYYYSYQAASLRAQNKIKCLLVTSWETISHNNETVKKKKELKEFVMRQADHFLCYTQQAKKCLIEEGIGEQKISVIHLGVDCNRFIPFQEKNHEQTLLFVGRLVAEKGIYDLMNIFEHIQKEFPHIKLHIIGDGPLKQKIMHWIHKNTYERVVKVGSLPYSHIQKIYQNSSLLLAPSRKTKTWDEQYGMVLVEAMASALPIINYNTGAILEVVGEAGILVEEGDVNTVIEKVSFLLRHPNEALKIGTIGRKRALERYNAQKTALSIAHVYETLCDRINS